LEELFSKQLKDLDGPPKRSGGKLREARVHNVGEGKR